MNLQWFIVNRARFTFFETPAFDSFSPKVHNEPMQLRKWIASLPGSPTVSQAADYAGVSKATLLRHDKKDETTAEYAVAIARAYGVNEVQALIDLDMLDSKAVQEIGIEHALRNATNEQLLDEIMRRSDPEANYLFGGGDDPKVIDLQTDALATPVDELAQRRRAETTPGFSETAPGDQAENYAADWSETEPEMGDDNYNDGP